MKRRGETFTLAAVLTIVMMAWIASGYRVQQRNDEVRDVADALDLHIPFNYRVSMTAGPRCDALDIEHVVLLDSTGEEIDYRWRMMDGEVVQLECEDFYDLYYRVEAPACFNVRVVTVNTAGQKLSGRRGHVCME
jgi:hypothetical protein